MTKVKKPKGRTQRTFKVWAVFNNATGRLARIELWEPSGVDQLWNNQRAVRATLTLSPKGGRRK